MTQGRTAMMPPGAIKPGALIELRDVETKQWIPLTIATVALDKVECRTLADEPILTTIDALLKNARLRPRDGSCRDCGNEAHDGPCIDRVCGECGVTVSSRCSQHPQSAVHVYRRLRYLAEIIEDKPYPTRETCAALQRDFAEQIHTLRNATEVRQGRYTITGLERIDIVSALENALKLIESLPSEKRRRSP